MEPSPLPKSRPLAAEEDPEPRALVDQVVGDVLDGVPAPVSSIAVRAPVVVSPVGAERPSTWAEKLVRWLDDGVRIPGTQIGIGLDPILGFFFPGIGDVVTGASSITLLLLALRHRVPTVILGRMLINIGVDTIGGSLPIIGDVFDMFWRSNRKNLELIEKYRDNPEAEPSYWDYLLVGTGLIMVAAGVALPFVLLYLLGKAGFSLFDTLFGG